MAVFERVTRGMIFPQSNENAVASFYRWLQTLFDHSDGYTVVIDKELSSPQDRQGLPAPCIVATQMDTTEPGQGFIGANTDHNSCLFYVYCLVSKETPGFNSARLLRRMKDQVVFCVKRAGLFDEAAGDVVVPAIALLDFSQNTPVDTGSTLVLSSSIVQHYTEDSDFIQFELVLSFKYIISGKLLGA